MHWDPGAWEPPRVLPVGVWHEASRNGWNSQVVAPVWASVLESTAGAGDLTLVSTTGAGATGAGAASAVAARTKAEMRVENCIFSDWGLGRFWEVDCCVNCILESGCEMFKRVDSLGFICCCHHWWCLRKSKAVSESPCSIFLLVRPLAMAILEEARRERITFFRLGIAYLGWASWILVTCIRNFVNSPVLLIICAYLSLILNWYLNILVLVFHTRGTPNDFLVAVSTSEDDGLYRRNSNNWTSR